MQVQASLWVHHHACAQMDHFQLQLIEDEKSVHFWDNWFNFLYESSSGKSHLSRSPSPGLQTQNSQPSLICHFVAVDLASHSLVT